MFKFIKITLCGLMALQFLSYLTAEDIKENFNNNITGVKNEILPKNVTLVDTKLKENILPENKQQHKEKIIEIDGIPQQQQLIGKEDPPNPLTSDKISLPSSNRTGRQLYYSPNYFYIQNFGAEISKCITSRGLLGICMSFNNCIQNHRRKRQLDLYGLQTYPQIMSYFQLQQQQQDICSFYDQFSRASSGVCCTSIQNITPIMPALQPVPEQPQELPQEPVMENDKDNDESENSEDSEVLEADLNNYQSEPPKYDNTEFQDGNNIGYDPIENLKQANLHNQYHNYNNYMRYPWPQQFGGFSGVQQWPPPLPTHPPHIASWPPPLPTHPPNHHYPTHPPFSGGAQFNPVATASTTTRRPITTTTRRPTYPNYPTYRPISTSTTSTTTTTKRPSISEVTGGSTALGLPLHCGLKNAVNPDQERIVGGTSASPYEFPWITVIFKSGKQFCGGSLITNNHILTAAHCVARMTSWDVAALTAHMGDYNIRTDFEVKHIERRIKRLVRHKGFDFNTLHNDIAILTLNEPVQFTKEIQPICLPTSMAQKTRSYSGQVATVAGWGSLRENGPQPSILQKVQIPIWTNHECANKYGRAAPGGIIESMICAGQVAKDSCSGDSGGPLIVNEGGRYTQVGIVSWGIGCGKGQYPGVYTRVTSLLPWIYKNIK